MSEKYNPKIIEKKWQSLWSENETFKSIVNKKQREILHFRNVSLSLWENSHGARTKLYFRRCTC